MQYKLFTAVVRNQSDSCVNLPGFSHRVKRFNAAYRREEQTVLFFARNRSDAAKQLGSVLGINYPCDLSEGKKSPLLCDSLVKSLDAYYAKK